MVYLYNKHTKNENETFVIFGNFWASPISWAKKGSKPDQNLKFFTSYDSATDSSSDDKKLIAVSYSQQKLWPFKKIFPNGNIVDFGLNERTNSFASDSGKLIVVCYSQQKL